MAHCTDHCATLCNLLEVGWSSVWHHHSLAQPLGLPLASVAAWLHRQSHGGTAAAQDAHSRRWHLSDSLQCSPSRLACGTGSAVLLLCCVCFRLTLAALPCHHPVGLLRPHARPRWGSRRQGTALGGDALPVGCARAKAQARRLSVQAVLCRHRRAELSDAGGGVAQLWQAHPPVP